MKYDITLRSLTGLGTPALIEMITGVGVAECLPTEFPETKDRRVDTLVRLVDGRILHIEWQAAWLAVMALRMLDYRVQILRVYPDAVIVQVVIQVGGDQRIADGLEMEGLSFRYRVIDSRTIDPQPLLDSATIEDNILAVLFGEPADLSGPVRVILSRLAGLEERARRDALTRLLILSGLRHAAGIVLKEATTMPLQVDIEQDPYLAELVLKGRIEGRVEGEVFGEAKALIRLTERRFGPLPSAVRARILAAEMTAIEAWFDRAIDAPSLDLVFAERPIN